MHTDRNAAITIRRLGEADDERIARLTQLDSASRPEGRLLGIEVEGRLLAVVSVETGELIADPFARTEELGSLLALRADQLRLRGRGERRPAGLRRRLPRRRRRAAAPALAGSPPGTIESLYLPPRFR